MLPKLFNKTKTVVTVVAISAGMSLASSSAYADQSYYSGYSEGGIQQFSVTNGRVFLGSERFGVPDHNFEAGVDSFEAGDYRDAEAHFQKHLALNSRSAAGHFMLGRTYIAAERWARASSALRTALRDDKNLHGARYLLAVSYLASGNLDAADEQLGRLDRTLAACDESCDSELVEAVGVLRLALTEQAS